MKKINMLLMFFLVVLITFLGMYFVNNKFTIPYIEEQKQLGYNLGVYQTALDQTQNSRVFYINQNNTLEVIGVEDLCGVEE